MKRAVVLISGGMDSATLLHYVHKRLEVPEIHALSFLYGQKHDKELEMARWQTQSISATHKEIDLSTLGEITAGGSALTDSTIPVPDLSELAQSQLQQPPTYVPNRNMIFLSLAAAYAESNDIQDVLYGAQAQDRYGYWDCTEDFVNHMNSTLALNRDRPVKIHAPFASMSKAEVLKIGLEIGVDYSHTWTCYRGGKEPCGTCPSCVERAAALREIEEGKGSFGQDQQD